MLAVLLTLLATSPRAQQRVFRATTDLVSVEVVVTDESGRPVHGLQQGDFVLQIDGVVVPVSTLAEVGADDRRSAPLFWRPAGDVASNLTSSRISQVLVIVVDDLHFRGRTQEVKRVVRELLTGTAAHTAVGLVTTSGEFGVEITEDRVRIADALDAFVDKFDPGRALSGPVGSSARVRRTDDGGFATDPAALGSRRGPADLGAFFSAFEGYKTVEQVARAIAADDGRRKSFVWIAAGLPGARLTAAALDRPDGIPDPCEGSSAWFCNAINRMFVGLVKAGATVYTVNPGGPSDGGDALTPIAEGTGGIAVRSEDPDAIATVVDSLNSYYSLGAYDAAHQDGGRHQLSVSMARPGLTVKYRRQFIGEEATNDAAEPEAPTKPAVEAVMPVSGLPLRIGASPLLPTSGNRPTPVLVTLELDQRGERALSGEDRLDFSVVAIDLKSKKVAARRSEWLSLVWPTGSNKREAYAIQTVVNLKPGRYQLRVSASSRAAASTGSVYLFVDVPDQAKKDVSLGAPVLRCACDDGTSLIRPAPEGTEPWAFHPSLSREFPVGTTLLVSFEVQTSGAGAVSGRIALEDVTGRVVRRIPWTATGQGPAMAVSVDLSGLEAGEYKLSVLAGVDERPEQHATLIRITR